MFICSLSHADVIENTKQDASEKVNLRGDVEVRHIAAHRELLLALRHKRAGIPRERARAGLRGVVVLEAHVVLIVALASVIRLRELQITRAVAGETSQCGVGESTDSIVLVIIGIHGELKKRKE